MFRTMDEDHNGWVDRIELRSPPMLTNLSYVSAWCLRVSSTKWISTATAALTTSLSVCTADDPSTLEVR